MGSSRSRKIDESLRTWDCPVYAIRFDTAVLRVVVRYAMPDPPAVFGLQYLIIHNPLEVDYSAVYRYHWVHQIF